jgi:hypothetical protein
MNVMGFCEKINGVLTPEEKQSISNGKKVYQCDRATNQHF